MRARDGACGGVRGRASEQKSFKLRADKRLAGCSESLVRGESSSTKDHPDHERVARLERERARERAEDGI